MAAEAHNRVDLGDRPGRRTPGFDDSARGRALAAMVAVVADGGYRDATVARVLKRSHVGWEEFVEQFGDLEGCLLATLDAGLECAATRAEQAVAAVGEGDVGAAFDAALRAVLDAAAAWPQLTALCVVEAPGHGAEALARREAGLQRLVELVDRGLGADPGGNAARPPRGLAAEMAVGGVYEVVQRKARAGEAADLPRLAPELLALWLPALRAV